MKGFSAPEIHGKWSLRASKSPENLYLKMYGVPKSNLLPNVSGLKGPLMSVKARYGIAWEPGAAWIVMILHLDTAREQFGKNSDNSSLHKKNWQK